MKAAAPVQEKPNEVIRIPSLIAPLKPLTSAQKLFVQKHHCFLVRNYEKVRVFREALQDHLMSGGNGKTEIDQQKNPEKMIITGLTALTTARSTQTRRLAKVQDDPKVTKVIKLAQILHEIFSKILALTDEDSFPPKVYARYFKELPTKKKDPAYFDYVQEPIDLSTIERNLNSGSYLDPDQFDKDLLKLFQNNLRHYGHFSKEGQAAFQLRKAYIELRPEYLSGLEELLGPELPLTSGFRFRKPPPNLNEDIIRCVETLS